MIGMKQKDKCCVMCNCNNPLMLTKDHVTPKSCGGTDEDSNIQTLCWTCNQLKGSLTQDEFIEYMEALKILKRLCKLNFKFPSSLPLSFSQHHYPLFRDKYEK